MFRSRRFLDEAKAYLPPGVATWLWLPGLS
jgi:hypothetical protein